MNDDIIDSEIILDKKTDNRQAASLPATRVVTDETTMAIEMPEPGSYYRLTPDYDVAAEERARKQHEDKIASFEHQQKYIKNNPHYKMDEKSQRKHPEEFVAPARVAKTIMLVKGFYSYTR